MPSKPVTSQDETTKPESSLYPEHEKLQAIVDKSQCLGEFLEWLEEGNLRKDIGPVCLAFRPNITEKPVYKQGEFLEIDHYEPIPEKDWERSSQLSVVPIRREVILARFFDIDLQKLDAEKEAMLAVCRELAKK